MSEQRESVKRLIEQNIKGMEQGMVTTARDRLASVLDSGQYDRDHSSDRAVYAAAKAFCEIYERYAEGEDV